MSDSTKPDARAWAEACEEDLAAERSRRQQHYGSRPGGAADELGRLVDSVARRIADFTTPLAGAAGESAGRRAAESAAEQWTRQLADGAKAVLKPVAERNPQVLEHLAAAGSELLSAYQAAVSGQERRWAKQDAASVDVTRVEDAEPAPAASEDAGGVAGSEREGAVRSDRVSGGPGKDEARGESGDKHGGQDPEPPSTERIDLD